MNGVCGTGIHTGAAVDAGIRVDFPLIPCFADGINRASFVTSAAVDAFVGNGMGQDVHLLFLNFD